jgi:hypothetical protein
VGRVFLFLPRFRRADVVAFLEAQPEVARMLGGEKLSGMVHAQTMLHGPRGTPTPRARQP